MSVPTSNGTPQLPLEELEKILIQKQEPALERGATPQSDTKCPFHLSLASLAVTM